MKLESKGIDCDSIMCGCSQNPKGHGKQTTTVEQPHLISIPHVKESFLTEGAVITFDQFYEIMCEKIKESRPNQNIIFESSK